MANIDSYLSAIKQATYGEEVRGSIHDAIEAINEEKMTGVAEAAASAEQANNLAQSVVQLEESTRTAATEAQNAAASANEVLSSVTTMHDDVVEKAADVERAKTVAEEKAKEASDSAATAASSIASIGDSVDVALAAATSAEEAKNATQVLKESTESFVSDSKQAISEATTNAQNTISEATTNAQDVINALKESTESFVNTSKRSISESVDSAQTTITAATEQAVNAKKETETYRDEAKKYRDEAKQVTEGDFVTHAEVGVSVASLEDGKVPESQLPDYVKTTDVGSSVASLRDGKVPKDQLPEDIGGIRTFNSEDEYKAAKAAGEIEDGAVIGYPSENGETVNIATTEKAGIVKPDGDTLTIDEDGTLHGSSQVNIATTENVGVVKPDGKTITVDDDGTLHGSSQVNIATTENVGVVKPDGKTVFVDANGVLSVKAGLTIPPKNPTNVSVKPSNGTLTVSWIDPEDSVVDGVTLSKWGGTILLYNTDRAPVDETDGTVVVDNTTRDKYAANGIVIDGLTNNQIYNLYLVPYSTDGIKGYSDSNRYTGKPVQVMLDGVTNITVSSGNGSVTCSWTNPPKTKTQDGATATWVKTTVVVKADSEPTSIDDGLASILTTYEKTTNVCSVENGHDYYVGFFVEADNGSVTHTAYSTPAVTYATVVVTTDEPTLYGKEITATYGSRITTATFSDSGSATMKIGYVGNVSISASDGNDTVTESITISEWKTYSIDLPFLKIVSFTSGTDEEIAKMIQAHYNNKIKISDYWAVGDIRSIALSAMSATSASESHRAQTVQFVIGDFDHDDLTTAINGHTKAAVTLLQKDCLMDTTNASTLVNGSLNTENGLMNYGTTNTGGWGLCARRTWCNSVYFAALPTTWQNMVKTVNKKSGMGSGSSSGTEVTADKIFLAAEIEVFGSREYSADGEGTQYQFYKNATANIYKKPKWDSSFSSNHWWERSPKINNTSTFCRVSNYGIRDYGFSNAVMGIVPHMCV